MVCVEHLKWHHISSELELSVAHNISLFHFQHQVWLYITFYKWHQEDRPRKFWSPSHCRLLHFPMFIMVRFPCKLHRHPRWVLRLVKISPEHVWVSKMFVNALVSVFFMQLRLLWRFYFLLRSEYFPNNKPVRTAQKVQSFECNISRIFYFNWLAYSIVCFLLLLLIFLVFFVILCAPHSFTVFSCAHCTLCAVQCATLSEFYLTRK